MCQPKRIVRAAIKGLAAIAALGFLAPTTPFTGLIVFVSSIVVLLVCLFVWHLVAGDEDVGYWPDKPDR
jgi:fatty acid desaturase